MRPFTFFKIRPAGVPSFILLDFSDMETAKRHAESLLQDDDYLAIEVTDGEKVALVTARQEENCQMQVSRPRIGAALG
jgi:hypothetical protein